jgi:hypothetical protein
MTRRDRAAVIVNLEHNNSTKARNEQVKLGNNNVRSPEILVKRTKLSY